MTDRLRWFAAGGLPRLASLIADRRRAKAGRHPKAHIIDSPASMSIHEETTVVAERPMMGVFNNLVMFDQHVAQNSLAVDPARSRHRLGMGRGRHRLTFHLRQGVKWHDGKPFTAADVKCTWDLLQGKTAEKLRVNPRKSWYNNLAEVVAEGDYQATFVLKRPQPAFSRCSPRACRRSILPCLAGAHAAAPDRHRPLQIRRVQAERVHQGCPQPRLLEAGPALSRRHRIHDLAATVRPRSSPLSPGSTS